MSVVVGHVVVGSSGVVIGCWLLVVVGQCRSGVGRVCRSVIMSAVSAVSFVVQSAVWCSVSWSFHSVGRSVIMSSFSSTHLCFFLFNYFQIIPSCCFPQEGLFPHLMTPPGKWIADNVSACQRMSSGAYKMASDTSGYNSIGNIAASWMTNAYWQAWVLRENGNA